MGLSAKLFLIAAEDTLQALADAAFMRMLRQESPSRLPDFAGQRVRLATLIVEMADRTPLRVVHRTFSMLDIDNDGRLDVARLNQQQFARMPDLLATGPQSPATGAPVVDAASRFIARGGSWRPEDRLLRRIDAALGHLSCRRVRVLR
ncbi:hypothetical protein QTI66_38440 [Variovorax sp. J22R133]|uniref:hypothetical protein n=1 Tax=Variovorax brevis TaxID=3053503 RepID=UPI002576A2E1|nr:hypothetical protein [Variovorax sp. J22R133]MDM0117969.1 hypothetical protein [Variovorax sp. J22R133]